MGFIATLNFQHFKVAKIIYRRSLFHGSVYSCDLILSRDDLSTFTIHVNFYR